MLAVEGFEGPLDWLLELVKSGKIDLARLSINDLIDAFIQAMNVALEAPSQRMVDLSRWAAWLTVAAELTLLRSRLLVPTEPERSDAIAEAESLRSRLILRAQMQAAATWLDQRLQLGRDVFSRGAAPAHSLAVAGRTASLTDLLRACLPLLKSPGNEDLRFKTPGPPPWSSASARGLIEERLPGLPIEGSTLEKLLPELPEAVTSHWINSALAATFAASLELARGGHLGLEQEEFRPRIRPLKPEERRDPEGE